ncbi:MAG TPA: histone deacetylase [Blastocatellia bacterium]|nr:histone deacetylase [Blastocatellia bacterium]
MTTALIYSDQYLQHETGRHPERRERYEVTISALMSDEDCWQELLKLAPRAVTDEEVRLCHEQRVMELIARVCESAPAALDADTFVSRESERIARLAAGGACRAVDAVINGEADNAFVACRPPGHHATVAQAMGFCLYNNVAIAARYAQRQYPQIGKVLIVDFDVHHGNGTQDIFYDDPSVFYYSLHQFPWYPGTGAASECGEQAGEGFTLNVPVPARTAAADYLRMFEQGLDSVMKRFTPDLVLVSAGFDAHVADPLGHLMLTDDDYLYLTRRLNEVARSSCGGRLVSCLEGGYNLRTLGATIHTHVAALAQA